MKMSVALIFFMCPGSAPFLCLVKIGLCMWMYIHTCTYAHGLHLDVYIARTHTNRAEESVARKLCALHDDERPMGVCVCV